MAEQTNMAPKDTFFWNLYAKFYDGISDIMPYRKLLWDTYTKLDLKPGLKVLDAGCGTGNFERFLTEKNAPPIEIEAVDFSTAMLSRAKNKCKDLDHACFSQVDLNRKLEFPDDTFDRIVSINVFYALEDSRSTLQELCRVLKPGGKLIITTSRPDFKFTPLIQDHFKRIGNIWGVSRKILTVLKTLLNMGTVGLVGLLLNFLVIERREKKGIYHSLSKKEFKNIFGIDELANCSIASVYCNQNWLAAAMKTQLQITTLPSPTVVQLNPSVQAEIDHKSRF